MKVIEPKVEILTPLDGAAILKHIEQCGRVAYKSEDRITEDSAEKFISNIIKRGHESVLEHFYITVKFTTDRGLSHEFVRHRLCAFTQESTRYCLYAKDKFGNEITVIKPSQITDTEQIDEWNAAMDDAEKHYMKLVELGCKPENARSVLPTCVKTELVVTTNIREWRHILKLRSEKGAHPDIRAISAILLSLFVDKIPILFSDIEPFSEV